MNTKHTPGPWSYRKAGKHFYIDAHSPDYGNRVTEVRFASNADTGWTSEANAKLIAAAPELLEALQAMLLVGEHTDLMQGMTVESLFLKRFEQARAAIERATK